MKSLIFLFVTTLFFFNRLYSQSVQVKPVIDTGMFGKWSLADFLAISNDGAYIVYHNGQHAVISSTHAKWSKDINNATDATKITLTQDSRHAVYSLGHDSLAILTLGSANIQLRTSLRSVQLFNKGNNGNWIVYRPAQSPADLIVEDFETGEKVAYTSVNGFLFSEKSQTVILQTDTIVENKKNQILKVIDLIKKNSIDMWQGGKASNFILDSSGTNFSFIAEEKKDSQINHAIWYYEKGKLQAEKLADDHSREFGDSLQITHLRQFNNKGSNLYFEVQYKKNLVYSPGPDAIKLDIWSYTDPKLQSQQLMHAGKQDIANPIYTAIIHLDDHKIILTKRKWISYTGDDAHIIVSNQGPGDVGNEWNWNLYALCIFSLLSTGDGAEKIIKAGVNQYFYSRLSPNGKYVVYYDPENKNYVSYEIASGRRRAFTNGIKSIWTTYLDRDWPDAKYKPIGIAGFIENTDQVLIYDQYNIWRFDLSGKLLPANLTRDSVKAGNIVFRLMQDDFKILEIKKDAKIILNAFNRSNKENGYYLLRINEPVVAEKLTMQPYFFTGPDEGAFQFYKGPPVKARDADAWIVKRQSAAVAPNYFFTTDFKTFKPVTSTHPENEYNWITSELHTWKMLDGKTSDGVLYKPENFDANKKYPVIFYYYEKFSEGLHGFLQPDVCDGPINIPYFVSNGYLVFVPDIPKKIGYAGESAVNAVVSAAKYLSKFPWVDAKHMGLQGHSFGGFETDYLITHSKLFAAAMSSCGMSDFISCYGSIFWLADGTSRQRQYEVSHDAMGASLWDIPDRYIANSPVLQANKVTTPLLMMNNVNDADVPFAQGVEFFTALRRLGKKVWMLQYDGEGHGVGGQAAIDYTIRMKQFFDHYLKGAPAPKWMVQGIPAKMKGIDDGLELMPAGVVPRPGLLNEEEQKKVDALQHRKPITITIK